jgi:hypothetical protein
MTVVAARERDAATGRGIHTSMARLHRAAAHLVFLNRSGATSRSMEKSNGSYVNGMPTRNHASVREDPYRQDDHSRG